ncbi:hypothetical protein [Streptomyces ardesiacus]|uniref:hypothetical protein n=1 Tax=Streptomyces ardesiacus TaxID=285564 RepID=UPI002FDC59BE
MTDQTTPLRDRIAAALMNLGHPQWDAAEGADAVLAELPAPPGRAEYDALVAEADRLRRDGAALHARAEGIDKQLAALQKQVAAPVDRRAVLREAADIAEAQRQFEPAYGARKSAQVSENVGILRVAEHLRRVADEKAATDTHAECTASRTGACLREAESETACDTEAGECVSGGQPAAGARQDGAQ